MRIEPRVEGRLGPRPRVVGRIVLRKVGLLGPRPRVEGRIVLRKVGRTVFRKVGRIVLQKVGRTVLLEVRLLVTGIISPTFSFLKPKSSTGLLFSMKGRIGSSRLNISIVGRTESRTFSKLGSI